MTDTKKKIWRVAGGILAVVTLAWAVFALLSLVAREHTGFQRTFAENVDTVSLKMSTGTIHVIADRQSGVSIEASGSRSLFDVSHSETINGSTLNLRSHCAPMNLGWCSLRYTIHVPRNAAITGHSDNGTVYVADANGSINLSTDNGSINATDVTSSVFTANTNNGHVSITFMAVPNKVQATSNNGSITLEVPANSGAYKTDTHADNGSVHNLVNIDSTSPHLLGAHSSNGSVTLRYGG